MVSTPCRSTWVGQGRGRAGAGEGSSSVGSEPNLGRRSGDQASVAGGLRAGGPAPRVGRPPAQGHRTPALGPEASRAGRMLLQHAQVSPWTQVPQWSPGGCLPD